MTQRGLTVGFVVLALVLGTACTREEPVETARTTIKPKDLPTPKGGGGVRIGTALAGRTKPPAPISETTPSATSEATPGATVKAGEPEATPAPTAISPKDAPARKGVVGRGADLLAEGTPTAPVLGTFQGSTNVDVVREEGGYAFVQAPVIGGGVVEGWVVASAVKDPSVAAPKPKPKAPPSGAPPSTGPPKKAPAPMKASGNGPDDILLVPIAGTDKKRPATPFTHKNHWDDYGYGCETCHHPVKALGGATGSYSCSDAGCHLANECNNQPVGRKNKACPNFEDAYHIQCIDCHKRDGGPRKCGECHTG